MTSILALLLLGGFVLAGCGEADKNPDEGNLANTGDNSTTNPGTGDSGASTGDTGTGTGDTGTGTGDTGTGTGDTGTGTGDTGTGTGDTGTGTGDTGTTTNTEGWTETEVQLMKDNLYGVVLPHPDVEDVHLAYNQYNNVIQMNAWFEEGDLAAYAAKYKTADGWVGGDTMADAGTPAGTSFAFQKQVTDHGQERFVGVEFSCWDQEDGEDFLSTEGSFYLYAADPYIYTYNDVLDYLGNALGQAGISSSALVPQLSGVSRYLVVPGDENDETPYLYVFVSPSNNPMGDMAYSLEHENWIVLEELTVDGFTVAITPDASAQIEYQYNQYNACFMIRFKACGGWNSARINSFFTGYLQTPVQIPALDIEGAKYTYKEDQLNGTFVQAEQYHLVNLNLIIKKTGLSTQNIITYMTALRNAGFVVNNMLDLTTDPSISAQKMVGEKLYTITIEYIASASEIQFTIPAAGQPDSGRLSTWPATQLATALDGAQDIIPAYTGLNAGFVLGSGYVGVVIDAGIEDTLFTQYQQILTTAHYASGGTQSYGGETYYLYRSGDGDGDVEIALGLISSGYRMLQISYRKVSAPVQPVWPTEAVAAAIKSNLFEGDNVTDTVPAMNMEGSTDEYVYTNTLGWEFSICIEFPTKACVATYEAILNETYTYKENYEFDTNKFGAWISPNEQMAIRPEYIEGYLEIQVKSYFEQNVIEAPYI